MKKEAPELCNDCICARHTGMTNPEKHKMLFKIKCIVYFDPPQRYIDEGKCPHYTTEEHVFYAKRKEPQ